MQGAPSSWATVVGVPVATARQVPQTSRCGSPAGPSSVVGLTTTPAAGMAYTVAPDWLLVAVSTPSRASRSSSSRASRPPSCGLTPSAREVHSAYQDLADVTGSRPSADVASLPPTRG